MPYMRMHHAEDPKQMIMKEFSDINNIEVFNTSIIVAIYVRPDTTKSGIVLPGQTRDEDKYQGKVGLVVKKGNLAFVDDNETWFKDVSVDVGDWVYFRPSEGWAMTIHGVLCRVLRDVDVRGKISAPDEVW